MEEAMKKKETGDKRTEKEGQEKGRRTAYRLKKEEGKNEKEGWKDRQRKERRKGTKGIEEDDIFLLPHMATTIVAFSLPSLPSLRSLS
jgi:hypothetical protein